MDTLNSLISYFGGWLVTVLPVSPFEDFFQSWEAPQWLSWLNWFFPVGACIALLRVWIIAIVAYYLLQIILRWVKAIQ